MLVGFGKPLLHTAALREKFVQDVVEVVDGVVEHEGQPVEGGRGLSRVVEQAQVFAGKDDAGDDAFQLDMQDLETFGRERYGGGRLFMTPPPRSGRCRRASSGRGWTGEAVAGQAQAGLRLRQNGPASGSDGTTGRARRNGPDGRGGVLRTWKPR